MATTNEAPAALLNAADRRARFPIIHLMRRVSRSCVSACGDVRGRVAATTSEEGGRTPASAAGSSTVPGRLGATRTMARVAVWCVRRFPGRQPSAWAARRWTGVTTWIVFGRHVSPALVGMDRAPICQNGPVLAPYEAGAPSRLRHLVISTLIALALVSHTALTSLHAQTRYPIDDWADTGGTVELSKSMSATTGMSSLDLDLPSREGESVTYYLRLSKQPAADGWWVRVYVNGVVYIDGEHAGISWVPSVGWPININNEDASKPTPWRSVTIYATEDSDADGEPIKITHEVSDEEFNCPPSLHGIAPVTVEIIDGGGGDGGDGGDSGGDGDGGGEGGGGGGDDDPPGLSIDDAPAVREGESAAFVVRLSAASGVAVTVAYRTMDGTAAAGFDYVATEGTLRFDAGETRTTLAVPTLEDATAEETEGFTVQLSDPSGATVADGTATGTITDDDERPGLSIDDAPAVREGESAAFVVRLSAASGVAVTVAYRTMDGTAVAGVDYTSTSGTLRFDAGETRTTLAVPTLEDATAEETEGFTVQLSDPSGATVADGTATGTITDDDERPGLSIDDAPAVREGETAEFVVRLSAASGAAVTVAYETLDGTAVAGVDYTSTSGTLRFDAGETRTTLAVPTLEDATAEETEGFTVQLREPSGATVADGTATGTITDDDERPGLSIDDAPAVREGETAEFVVRLSAASGAAVTVAYETLDGTAVAGVDYTSTSGTLRFDAGETRTTLAVPTLEDATAEETEGFTVQLREPSGATVADGTATGTITDDDERPGLSIDDAPAVREGETAEFIVRLSAASGVAVTVAYRTMDGTAAAGFDYVATEGTLRFDAGETRQTLAVPTLEDATAEETEGFTVQLREPSGATVADGTATGTITDDDDPPGLSIDDAPAVREGETAEFIVRLSAASGVAVTVAYRTMDGTAAAGFDYVATEGTLRFDAGETRQTLAVPTLEDATAEETEGFTVQLREPSGATVADGTATGTITDDVQQRIGVINDVVLPEVGRALAFSAVRCRIDQVLSGSAPRGKSTEPSARLALSPEARSGRWAAPGVQSSTLVQAFDDSLFLMQSQEEEDGEGRFAAWWCPDYQNLGGGGRGGGITWDGGVSSWHAGVDARIGPDLLAGVSFSRSRGSFNYQGGGRNLDAGRGTYALGLVGIHPYLAWSVLPDLDVWGTVGHAWGDLRVVDAAAGNVLTSPAALDSGVVGVSGRLLTRGATTLRLKGEWALAQMNIARASTAFDAAAVDMQRLRMGAEVSYQHALSSGASLIPWGEVNLRHDGGDGEIGAGLELGGGLRHRNHEAGLTVEGHGRWLLIHRGTLREWGVGGLVRFAPKAVGRGPSVSLMPTWGESASGAQQLWERGATDRHVHSAPGARLDAEFGYGFGALRDRGVLTPYVGLSLVGEAARGYRLGGRLAVGQSATVSLEAERRQHLAAARIHAFLLLGTLQF